MAVSAVAPKRAFRLGMLVDDTRYRAITIQLIVLLLVVVFFLWVGDNTIRNLAAKDKDIDFGFLLSRAGYDIEQHLIPYSNDSIHARALVVGLLNTLLVAVLGCFLATVIGVLAGVLRLSKNWLVARLMTVYVEVFRNIPLLLWILLLFTFLSESRPSPRDFKLTDEMLAAGELPKAEMIFGDSVAITNRGTNTPWPYLRDPLPTFELWGVSINLGVVTALGIILAAVVAIRALHRRAARQQEATGQRPTLWWIDLFLLVVPLATFLIWRGVSLDYPTMRGFNFRGGISMSHSFAALLIALSLYTGSYIAEAVRGGVLAIAKGQTEAAHALGLRQGWTVRLVVLPQALRVIIPPLISQYLNLTKNTTLGIAIGYLDLKGTLGGITLNQTGRELECMLLMMLIYLTLSLIISAAMNAFNASVALKER